jgi:hypothetical protein
MKLHILGRNSDDKGTQLEILTKEILESLGYTQLKMNVASDAGEVDVDGEFVTPMPVEPKRTRLVAECKAHKSPLNMTDWLKFLGKVFIAEANSDDVVGCLVALSGVNGNVQGSADALQRNNIRLVGSITLIDYLAKSYGLLTERRLQSYLMRIGLGYLSVDLAYYHRRVYWVVSYEGGKYTTLAADINYPDEETLSLIKPLVEQSLEVGTFIDLRKEEAARQARMIARKLIMAAAMLGGGSATTDDVRKILEEKRLRVELPPQSLTDAARDIMVDGTMVADNTGRLFIRPDVETDAEARRQFFIEFGREVIISLAIGCEWWDAHINGKLFNRVCEIQAGLVLKPEDKDKAVMMMRLSPTALLYAITPDPMIVSHPENSVLHDPSVIEHDRNQFLRSLHNGLYADFRNPQLARYFHETRRIEILERTSHMKLYSRDDETILDDNVVETSMIAQWHENSPTGEPIYIHVSALPDFAERRKAAKQTPNSPAEGGSA